VGAILSNEISKIYGAQGLPEDTILVDFEGSAGQSFGAFTNGLSFKIHGNCNDYLGKDSQELNYQSPSYRNV
jgi:glutamate synthase (ferredoxin)